MLLKIPEKTHFLLLLLTFSHIFSVAKQIYNFIPPSRNTNKTQKKKIHNPVKLREEGRERGDWVRRKARLRGAVLRSGLVRCYDCNRRKGEIAIGDDESGSRTIGFRVRRERSVLGGSMRGCDDLAGGVISAMRV